MQSSICRSRASMLRHLISSDRKPITDDSDHPAEISPRCAEALGRELLPRRGAGHQHGRGAAHRPANRAGGETGRANRDRYRRREYSPRRPIHRRQLEHSRSHGPLYGHAGHGDQWACPTGRTRIARLPDSAADGHSHGRRRRAVYPPPGKAASRKRPDRHPRRGNRQPVRHHRHGRGSAGTGDRGRHSAQSDSR